MGLKKTKLSPSPSIFRKVILFPLRFIFFACIFLFSLFYVKDFSYISYIQNSHSSLSNQAIPNVERRTKRFPFAIGEAKKGCDVFSGKWMHDSAWPLYKEHECPYLENFYRCQEYGRPDKDYQRWRWQPHGCSLPSFNATLMLESLRGKRMILVGDSINRNQYFSLVCLLQRNIPEQAKSIEVSFSSLTVFTAKDYNTTIEYYWAPFLLESNADPNVDLGRNDRLIRNGSINVHGKHWKGADIIVFNSYIWWRASVKLLRSGSFDDKIKDIVAIPKTDLYRMAITGMTEWIGENINPKKTRVFFSSLTPLHRFSRDWGGDPQGSCYNETTPTENITNLIPGKDFMSIITEELKKSKVPVTLLNITHLSCYRKDGHTSIYNFRWNPLTPEQLANPVNFADCIHWCVPGVPDAWNELLFWKIFYP